MSPCSVSPGTPMPLRTTLPKTGLEGKFSMEYCIASALIDGGLTLGSFTDSAVAQPDAATYVACKDDRGRPTFRLPDRRYRDNYCSISGRRDSAVADDYDASGRSAKAFVLGRALP